MATHFKCDFCAGSIRSIPDESYISANVQDCHGRAVVLPSENSNYGQPVWSFYQYDLCALCIASLAQWAADRKAVKVRS